MRTLLRVNPSRAKDRLQPATDAMGLTRTPTCAPSFNGKKSQDSCLEPKSIQEKNIQETDMASVTEKVFVGDDLKAALANIDIYPF